MDTNQAVGIVALVIGSIALVFTVGFGIWQTIFNRRVDQQLLGGGTTLLEVRWIWPDDHGSVRCQAQAKGVPLSNVAIKFGQVKKSIGDLSALDTKTVDFNDVRKGEKWTVTFVDPNKRQHKESYLIWGNDVELFG